VAFTPESTHHDLMQGDSASSLSETSPLITQRLSLLESAVSALKAQVEAELIAAQSCAQAESEQVSPEDMADTITKQGFAAELHPRVTRLCNLHRPQSIEAIRSVPDTTSPTSPRMPGRHSFWR